MKRHNNLFDKICDLDNLRLATQKAKRNKRCKDEINRYYKNEEDNLFNLYTDLLFEQYHTSKYKIYKIYEPKEREIYKLPFYPDRIVHHAIMNVLDKIWVDLFIPNTYSCIKNRGIIKLRNTLYNDLVNNKEQTKYCLKLDIKKFYPSIDHDILKQIIRHKIKDRKLLRLLDEIIDSAPGVPIGNYLSQFFANLYLNKFDHWIHETLRIKYYYRYCDDIVILSSDKGKLHKLRQDIQKYLKTLKLELKDNYSIYPVNNRGISFVGYKFYHDHILLRKSIKNKIWRLIQLYLEKRINKLKFKRSIQSYYGWLKYCNSKRLLSKIYELTGIKFNNFSGIKIGFNYICDKNIKVYDIVKYSKYFKILGLYKGKSIKVYSRNNKLYNNLNQISNFPKSLKLKEYV